MAGRPTKYLPIYNKQAYKLCLLGATDIELADFFEVDEATVNRWKLEFPQFCVSIKKGKEIADAEVANKLYRRATGYSHPEVDIKMYEGGIITTKLTKHYPPDTTAAIFWLKNRKKDKWRDKQEVGLTDKDGNDMVHIFQLPDNGRNTVHPATEGVPDAGAK